MDGRTDTPSYRDARTHLKISWNVKERENGKMEHVVIKSRKNGRKKTSYGQQYLSLSNVSK